MTDAEKSVPVRSDESEECISCLGNSFYLQCSKLRRLKFPVISICNTRRDVSMVIVAEGTFKPKDTDKNTL